MEASIFLSVQGNFKQYSLVQGQTRLWLNNQEVLHNDDVIHVLYLGESIFTILECQYCDNTVLPHSPVSTWERLLLNRFKNVY